jgi:nucleoside-diphosphate-sugar epimerase
LKLLLTGAGGFFGSNLVDLLSAQSAAIEIHAVQRRPLAVPGVTTHRVDLFDRDATTSLVKQLGPTHLCHLAWLGPETTDRYRSPENQRWVEASKALFDAFGEAGGRRLVHLGSCIEYGNRADGPRVETQPLDPDTAYGEAKAELSTHINSLAGTLSAAVARPFFCYGPHEQPDRLVPSLILGLARNEIIDLTEGRQRRDYLDVRDVAAALLALLQTDGEGAFNIGAGAAVEVRSIAERLGRIAGKPELLNFGGRPEGADSAPEIVADIGRVTSVTGWRPTIGLDEGLANAANWWRTIGHAPSTEFGGIK